jgi:hypothetical protein
VAVLGTREQGAGDRTTAVPAHPRHADVEGNERLTALTGALLLLLVVVEGVTIPFISPLLSVHVIVGMILIPPVLLKLSSTGWRFLRYYTGQPDYVRRGPPRIVLRALAPFLATMTVLLLATGIALVAVRHQPGWLYFAHKAVFVLWFAALAVHLLGYLWRVPRVVTSELTSDDHAARTLRHRLARPGAVLGSLAAGLVLAAGTWTLFAPAVHQISGGGLHR